MRFFNKIKLTTVIYLEGKFVGQLVNAGQSHELVSDIIVNDNRWHTIYWEIDTFSMKLIVDRREKLISSFYLLPSTFTYIIGLFNCFYFD